MGNYRNKFSHKAIKGTVIRDSNPLIHLFIFHSPSTSFNWILCASTAKVWNLFWNSVCYCFCSSGLAYLSCHHHIHHYFSHAGGMWEGLPGSQGKLSRCLLTFGPVGRNDDIYQAVSPIPPRKSFWKLIFLSWMVKPKLPELQKWRGTVGLISERKHHSPCRYCSVIQCPPHCNPTDCSMPGLLVPAIFKFTQVHVPEIFLIVIKDTHIQYLLATFYTYTMCLFAM